MEYIKFRFLDNMMMVSGVEMLWNVLLGLIVGIVASVFLYRGVKKEDSYYSFHKKDALFTIIAALVGMVVFVSPIPTEKSGIMGLLAIAVCMVILLITSYTDEKTGMFTFGYLLIGVSLEVLLMAAALISKKKVIVLSDVLILMGFAVLVVVFGLFCYSLGDAGLLLMVYLALLINMETDAFIIAMAFVLLIAAGSFLVRYAARMIRARNRKGVRLPFTVHILIGMVLSLFLFK